jgi:hypothetical protein
MEEDAPLRMLFGKVVDDEGDGKPYANEVREDCDDMSGKREGRAVRGGIGRNDPVHEEIDHRAVKNSRDDGLLRHEDNLSAGKIKNCCGAERDEEMNRQAERGCGHAHLKRFRAEQSRSDPAEDARGLHSFDAPGDKGSGYVHDAASEASPEYGRERTRDA